MTRWKRKPFSSWRGQLFIIPVSRAPARPIELGSELILASEQIGDIVAAGRQSIDLSLDAGEFPFVTPEPKGVDAPLQAQQPRLATGRDARQQLLFLIG